MHVDGANAQPEAVPASEKKSVEGLGEVLNENYIAKKVGELEKRMNRTRYSSVGIIGMFVLVVVLIWFKKEARLNRLLSD
jgi:hypothetical protein